MSTLPSRIREACGVERFDVADTQNTLESAWRTMTTDGVDEQDALTLIGAIYRTAQRELTTKTT